MREAVSLRDLYAQYNEQVQFLVIYIREAHPVDGWDVGSVNRIYDPKTIEERRNVAGMCEVSMQYGIRTYVDEMDDAVMMAYAAWPERLYLIGLDGRIDYAGGLGPFGFEPVKLKAAIDHLLHGLIVGDSIDLPVSREQHGNRSGDIKMAQHND